MPRRKKVEQKFVEGNTYLMEHKHFAFGGGMYEVNITRLLEDEGLFCANEKWHKTETYLESRRIVADLGKEEEKEKEDAGSK